MTLLNTLVAESVSYADSDGASGTLQPEPLPAPRISRLSRARSSPPAEATPARIESVAFDTGQASAPSASVPRFAQGGMGGVRRGWGECLGITQGLIG